MLNTTAATTIDGLRQIRPGKEKESRILIFNEVNFTGKLNNRNNRMFCVDLIIHNEYLMIINILEHSNMAAMSLKQKSQDMQEKVESYN